MKIRLVCPEGWKQCGFQRLVCDAVECSLNDKVRIADTLKQWINDGVMEAESNPSTGFAFVDGNNLFVESGEGTTLHDFADSLQDASKCVVEYKDADDEGWQVC
jgi:hypothetical protein